MYFKMLLLPFIYSKMTTDLTLILMKWSIKYCSYVKPMSASEICTKCTLAPMLDPVLDPESKFFHFKEGKMGSGPNEYFLRF